MPFERRDIHERTVFPKHIFSVPPSTVLIRGGGGGATRIYEADVAAETAALSGLGVLDGVTLAEGMRVFVHAERAIFAASSGAWQRLEPVSAPALVLVRLGNRWGGSVHAVDSDKVWAHFAAVYRSGSIGYTLTIPDWTPLQIPEALVPSPDVTTNPYWQFNCAGERLGVYAIHVHVCVVPESDQWSGTVSLALLRTGLLIPYDQPLDVRGTATAGAALTLSGSLVWRVTEADRPIWLGLQASPATTVEVKAYVGLHRLL
jgi:hypothetical protein